MGALEVRRAIKDWFAPPIIAGLQTVYAAQPWIAITTAWELSANSGFGAIAWVHFPHQDETRIAFDGIPGGMKQITYDVGLVLLYQYLIPANLGAGEDESSWVGPLDQMLTDIKARLREDQTLGTGGADVPGLVWQAGEDQKDIAIDQDFPTRDAGKVHSWNALRFQVVENVFA